MSVNKELRAGTEDHKLVLEALLARKRVAKSFVDKKKADWERADRECSFTVPERDADAARRSSREAGSPNYTTIQIPYSYAQMLTAHTYYVSVLLGRSPVWQFEGNHGEGEMNIKALEALMNYQMNNGMQLPPMYVWFMDAVKYGLGVVMEHWWQDVHYVSQMVQAPVMIGSERLQGQTKLVKQTDQIKGYTGNRLINVSPYDLLPDPRVGVHRLQEGEFFGRLFRMGWNEYIRGTLEGRYFNREYVERHVKSGANGSMLAELFEGRKDQEEFGLGAGLSHTKTSLISQLPGFQMVVEVLPSEWKLGTTDYPEKWVFSVLDDKVIVEARPLGCLHNQFPFGAAEVEIEGYEVFRRGMLETGRPLNNVLDWLINSHFYAVRKDLNGSLIYDPSKVVAGDLLKNTPGHRIRLHPNAYGSDVRQAITSLTTGPSVTGTHLRDSDVIMTMMQRVLGVSESGMGALPGSSRRTATEVRSSSAGSITRLKTMTEFLAASAMAPLGGRLVKNTQQYYTGEQKFLIAGDQVVNPGGFIDVTPEMIAGSYQFAAVDGALPVDRFAQVTMWTQLFQQMRTFPQLAQEYRISDIFAWVAQLAGLKNIKQFRVQLLPPGAQPDPNGVSASGIAGLVGGAGASGFAGGDAGGAPVIPLAPQAQGMGRAL